MLQRLCGKRDTMRMRKVYGYRYVRCSVWQLLQGLLAINGGDNEAHMGGHLRINKQECN